MQDMIEIVERLLKNDPNETSICLRDHRIENLDAQVLAATLRHNTTLKNIDLSHNLIGDVGALHLAKLMTASNPTMELIEQSILIFLYLSITTMIGENIGFAMRWRDFLANFFILYLFTRMIVISKRAHSNLKSMNLSWNLIEDTGAQSLALALGMNSNLDELLLCGNQIGYIGAKNIAEALKINTNLKNINLGYNRFGPLEAKVIAEGIRKNRGLQSIVLDANQLGDEGIQDIFQALKFNRSLESVHVRENQIGAQGLQHLELNKSLKTLHLDKNMIGQVGAKYLADALRDNSSLKELSLVLNSIGDAGLEYIAEALKVNVGLESINLGVNLITESSLQALATALESNKSLKVLNLHRNHIGDEGLQYLVEALTNVSLQQLDLFGNQITDAGVYALAKALEDQASLEMIDLGGNQMTDMGAGFLYQALRINSCLKSIVFDEEDVDSDLFLWIQAELDFNAAFQHWLQAFEEINEKIIVPLDERHHALEGFLHRLQDYFSNPEFEAIGTAKISKLVDKVHYEMANVILMKHPYESSNIEEIKRSRTEILGLLQNQEHEESALLKKICFFNLEGKELGFVGPKSLRP